MKRYGWMLALPVLMTFSASAIAQSRSERSEPYVPRLGDIMIGAQTRHIKLWYAGKAGNWDLAGFELGQLKTSLVEAALLYSGIPVSNVTTLSNPLQAVEDAIGAKDGKRFEKAYGDLTAGCNACHGSMQRSFIAIRPPTDQPFGDQVFAPGGKK